MLGLLHPLLRALAQCPVREASVSDLQSPHLSIVNPLKCFHISRSHLLPGIYLVVDLYTVFPTPQATLSLYVYFTAITTHPGTGPGAWQHTVKYALNEPVNARSHQVQFKLCQQRGHDRAPGHTAYPYTELALRGKTNQEGLDQQTQTYTGELSWNYKILG